MIVQPPHQDLPTTSFTWYTPHKQKNVSSIQTNPSVNIISFPSNQYSAIELSQSMSASPSFLSPNKQIGSFLMTPNYSSKHQLSAGSQLTSQFRLKTESLVETSKFQDKNYQNFHENKQVSLSDIRDIIKLIQQLRVAKCKKEDYSRKIQQKIAVQSFLMKQINQKEDNILYHKKEVQKRIQKKNKLKNKIKMKRIKIKQKTSNLFQQMQSKIKQINEEYETTQKLIQLQQLQIARFKNQVDSIQFSIQQKAQLNSLNQFQSNHYYPYFMQPMYDSKIQKISLQNIPNFYSNPNSLKSQQNAVKKSQESKNSTKTKKSGSGSEILDKIQQHISKGSKGDINSQQQRKFSFGQNPSFNMYQYYQNPQYNQIPPNKHEKQKLNPQNFIQQALIMKMNQYHGPESNQHSQGNVQSMQAQNYNNIENISQIASHKNIKFNQQFSKKLQKPLKKNITDKIQLHQIIDSLSGIQDCPEDDFYVQNYNESKIFIGDQTIYDSPLKSSPRLPFNRKSLQNAVTSHKKSPSGQTVQRSLHIPLNLQQSQVNIACGSSEASDYVMRHEFFSPRKDEQILKRTRSPTHQQLPKIFQEIQELRKTQNQLKGSNSKIRDSSKNSGVQTPIFRSENSEQFDENVRFSQPFMQGQLKESQFVQRDINLAQFQGNDLKQKINNLNKKNKKGQKNMYSSQMIQINTSFKSKDLEPYSISQALALNTIQSQEKQIIEKSEEEEGDDDEDFYSCTLGTQSKVIVSSQLKSHRQNQDNIENQHKRQKQQKKIKSSRNRYHQQEQIHKNVDKNIVLQNEKHKHEGYHLNLSELGYINKQQDMERFSVNLEKHKNEQISQKKESKQQSKNNKNQNLFNIQIKQKDNAKSTI